MIDHSVPLPQGGMLNVWNRPAVDNHPTVVLSHGLTGTSRWWIPVIRHLPTDLGIIAIDCRGRGESWEAPGPFGIDAMAHDVIVTLDHFGIDVALTAGYSMGAWIVARLAHLHPARVSRVVMIDGGLPIPVDKSLTPDQVLDIVIGPSLQRLSMTFGSVDEYFDFYRRHPAFAAHWVDRMEEVFGYDLGADNGVLRVRANPAAVAESGRDITVNLAITGAGKTLPVPGRLVVVDHGMLGQPGGFVPEDVARVAATDNPNLSVTMLNGFNHYTLLLGEGAPLVAGLLTEEGRSESIHHAG